MVNYSVFDALFDSVFIIDENRKIIYCNETAAHLSHSSVKRLSRGVIFSDLFNMSEPNLFPLSGGPIGREKASPLQEVIYEIKDPSLIKSTTSLEASRPSKGKVQITIQPFVEGSVKRWTVVLRDVTLEETLHHKYQGQLALREKYIAELQEAKIKLEDYSNNLAEKVAERTFELQNANHRLNAVMNSLGQGFLIIDKKGICSDLYTKACLEVLEKDPSHKPIGDVLNLSSKERDQFNMWMQAVFSESLPFEDLATLAPDNYKHTRGERITLHFFPLRDDQKSIQHIVLVATNRTSEFLAKEALSKEQNHGAMILKMVKYRQKFTAFINSIDKEITSIHNQIKNKFILPNEVNNIYRYLHTIEGEAGLYSLEEIRECCRQIQTFMEPWRQGDSRESNILLPKVLVELEKIKKYLKEFRIENTDLLNLISNQQENSLEISLDHVLAFGKLLQDPRLPLELQTQFLTTILKQPILPCLKFLDDVAQQVATTQNKKLYPIYYSCENVYITPKIYDALLASLVHAIRNAVDHGIEPPEVRKSSGKEEMGTIRINCTNTFYEGQPWIQIQISDDGSGIDVQKIRNLLPIKFPTMNLTSLSDFEILQTVFLPGFSSREQVSQFSGRGVGLDAVKSEVELLKGNIQMDSKPNNGSVLTINIPKITKIENLENKLKLMSA
ncbi:MAG: Hpt domain-containing protein [Bdellovibrionales bacterium]|nr:Hpt domain-containing protein [Bdellovibrionales bacterium]